MDGRGRRFLDKLGMTGLWLGMKVFEFFLNFTTSVFILVLKTG